ncbi:MAG: hypothetical protein M1821_002199 [Bathelium mastoideum]|nr:MAG: hypothetical protein M1821_002199 [Bathelium mastoideum]
MARPVLIFGTATFGMDMTSFQDSEDIKNILQTLKKLDIVHLDTAARYPPLNPGRSEQLIGETIELSKDFTIDTKVAFGQGDPSGSLTPDSIETSVKASFERLQRQKVRVLYAHTPDKATPLHETAAGFDAQIRAGHCNAWGVSNYPPTLLRELLTSCEEKGYHKPRFYQGDYNILTRGMETQLLPLLRQHNIHYIAFRSAAAGFLTGKLLSGRAEGTRLAPENPLGNRLADGVFGSQKLREVTSQFIKKVERMGLNGVDVALRWIYWHSPLGEGDGVILGASTVRQIEQNKASLEGGPLDQNVLQAVEELWAELKAERESVL